MRKISRLLILLVPTLFLSACLGKVPPFLPEPAAHYTLEGLEQDTDTKTYLETILKDRIATPLEAQDEDQQARALSYRERMIRGDLFKALQAKGYYAATIRFKEGETSASGTYHIDSGPLYTIKSIAVTPKAYAKYMGDLGIEPGDPLDAQAVLAAQATLQKRIEKDSCALTLDITHKALAPLGQTETALTFTVKTGPESTFGPLTFTGQETVKESYLNRLVPWKEGDCFKRRKLASLQEKLLSGGLFASADIATGTAEDTGNAVPVTITVKERAQRTLRAGLSYYTDEGPGATLGWEHRNFLGHAEQFNADLSLSSLEQSLKAHFTRPYFLRNDQSLSLSASLDRQNTDAYEEIGIGTGFRVNRTFTKKLSGSAGADLSLSRIKEEDDNTTQTYGLVSGSVSVVFDTRDDTLDPHKGILASAETQPFFDVLGESAPFFKNTLSASAYHAIHKRTVLAARAKVGSIAGAHAQDVPATERFYAGGGGSVRGFGYQDVGPLDGTDPIGGRSLVELSTEARFKITPKFGAVLFIDAGNVASDTIPTFDDIAVGAGIGFRYYTGFGPLRFDIATPIAGDEHVDKNYQIYISIGQAF